MGMEEIKEATNDLLGHAQALLKKDGYVRTVIFPVKEDKFGAPVEVSTNEGTDVIVDLVKELTPVSDGIIIIMNAHLGWYDKNDPVPQNLEGEEGVYQALIALAHTKDGKTSLKQIGYIKEQEQDTEDALIGIKSSTKPRFSWYDMGWKDTEALKGALKNPFK